MPTPPTPPKDMRRVPPPPRPANIPPRPAQPTTVQPRPQPQTKPMPKPVEPAVISEQKTVSQAQNVQKPIEEPVKVVETAPSNIGSAENKNVEKQLKKEKKRKVEEDDIDIVAVPNEKKFDTKAMIYYIGIFASLAIIAVMIFLILK